MMNMKMQPGVLFLSLFTCIHLSLADRHGESHQLVTANHPCQHESCDTNMFEANIALDQNHCVIVHEMLLLKLNCSHNHLSNFPVSSFKNSEKYEKIHVDVSHNSIMEMPKLDETYLFSGVPVVSLNLSYNKLKSELFTSLVASNDLLYLDVSYNRVKHFPRYSGSLEVLRLSGNLIHMDNNNTITIASSLRELYVDNNAIADIDTICNFNSGANVNLEILNMTKNQITKITRKSVTCLNKLRNVYIASNNIMEVEEEAFDTCTALELLDLSRNSLESLPKNLFRLLDNLKYLYLSHNKLMFVPEQIPMIIWLDLSFNNIAYIPEQFSKSLYPQEVFLLGGNPLVCDCEMLWLKELYGTREYLMKYLNIDKQKFIPTCASPHKLANIPWSKLEDKMFTCSNVNGYENGIHVANQDNMKKPSLTVSVIGSDFVSITWAENQYLEHDSVHINYHKFGKRDQTMKVVMSLSKTSYKLKSLHPNTPYVICLEYLLQNQPVSAEECIELMTSAEDNYILYIAHIIHDNKCGFIFGGGMLCLCIGLVFTCKIYNGRKHKTS